MHLIDILQAGVASGTVLLFATLGELLAERSGVMNLGVEGMMLIGAMSAYSIAVQLNNPWLGVVVAMLFAGLLSQIHAFIVIGLQADQVVSGLALTFVGAGVSLVLGEGLSKAGAVSLLPTWTVPGFSSIPVLGPVFFTQQSVLVYLGYLMTPLAWYYINRTRPGLHLRAVGEFPAAADALGINVFAMRYAYVFVGRHAGGLGGRYHQPGRLSRLVQRADHRRTGMDRRRPCDLCAVGSAAGRCRIVCFRSAPPPDPGHPGANDALRAAKSLLLQSLLGILPADDPVRLHDHRPGDRLTRGHPETDWCARRHLVSPTFEVSEASSRDRCLATVQS